MFVWSIFINSPARPYWDPRSEPVSAGYTFYDINVYRKTRSASLLFAGKRDKHTVHGPVWTRIRRRTSATLLLHSTGHGEWCIRELCGNRSQRPTRPHSYRSHRFAAIHPIRGHGIREQREGLKHGSCERLRRDGS